ncbi:MAG TPA: branched-chain amino acid ABC transporter substrate-binding protein [Anaerolineales bacterium]|nr:branched-chain amino acid ABC transporter substrate-binding protein [Anaerolineales bacterium]
MKRASLVAFSATSIAALVLAACAPAATPAPSVETVRIYSSLPLTGSSAGQTTTIVNAINLAIEQQTDGGLVCDGKIKIDYVSLDDATAAAGQWDAAKEQENANKAVADADTMVYIGTFNSGAARVSIPILNEAGIVMISPANTADDLTAGEDTAKYYPNGVRNYTRVVARDAYQGAFAAKWAAKLGAKNVYILDDTQIYGKGVADQFEANTAANGLTVVGRDGIDGKAADYKALATKIAGTSPDLIYYGGITQNNAGQLLKDIRAAGITAMFMGPDGILESAFIEAAGADVAEGVYGTIAGNPRAKLPEAGQKFYSDYQAKFNSEPEAYAIYGFEAASVAIKAISTVCVKDRAAILSAVYTTKDFAGVLGTWSFDENGDTNLYAMLGNVVKSGKWEEAPADILP